MPNRNKINKSFVNNIPNTITIFRFFLIIPVLYFAHLKLVWAFVLSYSILRFLDFVDGYLARKLNAVSDLGSKLDSLIDTVSEPFAFFGFYLLNHKLFTDNIILWILPFSMLFAAWAFGYTKTGKLTILHLYSNKAFGLFYSLYLITGAIFGPIKLLLIFVCLAGVLASIEQIVIFLKKGKTVTLEEKGLFFRS